MTSTPRRWSPSWQPLDDFNPTKEFLTKEEIVQALRNRGYETTESVTPCLKHRVWLDRQQASPHPEPTTTT